MDVVERANVGLGHTNCSWKQQHGETGPSSLRVSPVTVVCSTVMIVRQRATSGAGVAAALNSSISVIHHHAVQFVNKGLRPAYLVLLLSSDLLS